MAKGKSSGGGHHRSAVNGRYVTDAHGKASLSTTVYEANGRSGSSGDHYRSAVSGRYVTDAYGKTHPRTTVKES